MSIYERVAAKPTGRRALAAARLRRSVLVALHRAFNASGLDSQTELAKLLHVRRSAVNQVFRGDGNLRINTLAEYLHEMGFEVELSLVSAGELRSAVVEHRAPAPAFPVRSSTTYMTFIPYDLPRLPFFDYAPISQFHAVVAAGQSVASSFNVSIAAFEPVNEPSAWSTFTSIILRDDLWTSGGKK